VIDLRLRAEESTDSVEIAIMIFPKVGDRESDRFVGRDTAAFQTHAFGGRDVPDRNVDREAIRQVEEFAAQHTTLGPPADDGATAGLLDDVGEDLGRAAGPLIDQEKESPLVRILLSTAPVPGRLAPAVADVAAHRFFPKEQVGALLERAKAMFAQALQESPRLAQGALVLLANKVLIALP
jgi:hypothetical protein